MNDSSCRKLAQNAGSLDHIMIYDFHLEQFMTVCSAISFVSVVHEQSQLGMDTAKNVFGSYVDCKLKYTF